MTLSPMLQNSLFYLFSFGVIAFAIGVVTARSAVYGVLNLVAALCMMAGLFTLLKAFLVATVLVLVYAGAVLVLFLFVVMLIDYRKLSFSPFSFKLSPVFAGVLCVLLFSQIFKVIRTVTLPENTPAIHGTAKAVGQLLFYQHLLPFELTSFLILAAVISVVVLAKKDAE
jgi:NADH-quinone oxidoreductase subunit J